MIPRVKICCISSEEEAQIAIAAGASALGLVGHMPSGPGIISDDLIRKIAKKVPPPIATFLLSSHTTAEDIIAHQQLVNCSTIQIVDQLQEGSYQQIRNSLAGIKLVQVIHIRDESSLEEAKQISNQVDALLLDSGNPNLSIKELGGTGRTHNWQISRKIVEAVEVPVFLAGGLSPKNIAQAIREVRPFGLDICSGVRSHGKLDKFKLEAFFTAIYNS